MDNQQTNTQTAIFAGGCFWGVEYYMTQLPGVLSVESGYTGGHVEHPSYKEVKAHTTGHAEAVRIVFDPALVDYETLAKRFFEIHDPCQADGQGIDIGPQYRSEIFYLDESQKAVAERLIQILRDKGLEVVTRVTPASTFWPARTIIRTILERMAVSPTATVM